MKKFDESVGQKFAIAAGMLMTRVFSTEPQPNPRRLAFACGPAEPRALPALPTRDLRFDVVGFGFTPGKEWKGPTEIFVEEMRGGEQRLWPNCRLYASTAAGPIYVLTQDPEVCFSYDGNSLITLSGCPEDQNEGVRRAKTLLSMAARHVPEEFDQHRMM